MVSFREGGFPGSWGKGEAGQEQPRFARGTLDYFLHNDELQSMGGTLGDTGRFQPCINTVHAVITFYSFPCFRVDLGNGPWAGTSTGHAAYTFFLINIDNTIIPFYHGTRRADRQTEWFFAVVARAKGKLGLGNTSNLNHY